MLAAHYYAQAKNILKNFEIVKNYRRESSWLSVCGWLKIIRLSKFGSWKRECEKVMKIEADTNEDKSASFWTAQDLLFPWSQVQGQVSCLAARPEGRLCMWPNFCTIAQIFLKALSYALLPSNLFTPHSLLLKVGSLQCQNAPPCMISSATIGLCLTGFFISLYALK